MKEKVVLIPVKKPILLVCMSIVVWGEREGGRESTCTCYYSQNILLHVHVCNNMYMYTCMYMYSHVYTVQCTYYSWLYLHVHVQCIIVYIYMYIHAYMYIVHTQLL